MTQNRGGSHNPNVQTDVESQCFEALQNLLAEAKRQRLFGETIIRVNHHDGDVTKLHTGILKHHKLRT